MTMSTKTATRRPAGQGIKDLGQVVLVLQGGGALGAYQVGVYQALHEAGIEPDWVVGTSIGAINASIIAGNPPEERLPRLREFWRRMDRGPLTEFVHATPVVGPTLANWLTIGQGIQSFFTPNPWAFASVHLPLGGESAGFYSTAPLERTLSESGRLLAPRRQQAPADGRRRERPHGRDALLRQPRRGDHGQARDGVGRAAAGLPGHPHRRRSVLGRRHPVQHPGRGRVRRQSPA